MKFIASVIQTVVYDADPKDYGTDSVDEMIVIDKENLNNEPSTISLLGDAYAVSVIITPIPESEK